MDTLGHLPALRVTPAAEQERAQTGTLAEAMQEATGRSVELAYVGQGYTGGNPTAEAKTPDIRLEVVQAPVREEGLHAAATQVGRRAKLRGGFALP